MKRIWTTAEYQRRQRIRQRKFARRQRVNAAARRRRARRSLRRVAVTALGPVVVTPPKVLSVVERPDETLVFCTELQENLLQRQSRVSVDLSDVERISSDALLLMRAIIDDAKGIYLSVGGPLPTDPRVAVKIKQSSFFTGFSSPPKDLPPPKGLIVRKSRRIVDSEIAAELVEFAMAHAEVSDGVADASYKTLVELMGNTHNHAGQRPGVAVGRGRLPWQASVYCEDAVAYFTFVDLGVGILRSPAPRSLLRELGASLVDYGEVKLLKQIFQGIVGASANVPGRGFGLQRMVMSAEAGLLPNLRVVTLSVAGDVAGMAFHPINGKMPGTLFRWTTPGRSSRE